MAALRCCSFNCRGWNSGSVFLKDYLDSFDLCFVQEHWLHSDNLNQINSINSDFLSVSVSGMDSGSLLCGRPYSGCTILYRKSYAPCITPISSCSQRFCGVKVLNSSGLSHLLISLYMPAACHTSSFVDYLNTLGELQGFLESQQCDVNILVSDFNVDFDCCSSLTRLLRDFMSEMSLHACDLSFHSSVKFTFERGDGLARSWIDHILCSKPFSTLVTNVHTLFSGSCLSDHFPLCFLLQIHCLNSMPSLSPRLAKRLCIDWSNASPSDLEDYCNMVSMNLPVFPSEVSRCVSTACSCHYNVLDTYAEHIVHSLHDCALHCSCCIDRLNRLNPMLYPLWMVSVVAMRLQMYLP